MNNPVLYWVPRVLGIAAILFISLFALDAFQEGLSFWAQLGSFFMHLIPSFILAGLLAIAWKWEMIGGWIFILLGLGLSPPVFYHNYAMNQSIWMSLGIILVITLPFVLIGILFIINARRNTSQKAGTMQ